MSNSNQNSPLGLKLKLTPEQFEWRSKDGQVETLATMHTSHLMYATRLLYNNFCHFRGGVTTPGFEFKLENSQKFPIQNTPQRIALTILFMLSQLIRRPSYPKKVSRDMQAEIQMIWDQVTTSSWFGFYVPVSADFQLDLYFAFPVVHGPDDIYLVMQEEAELLPAFKPGDPAVELRHTSPRRWF